jgi:hypothetical protein
MAKQSLRDFQAQLAERLSSAAQAGQAASKLGFLAGGRYWLVDLTEIDEVVTVTQMTPVPRAKPWFLGLTNLRGLIYGCTDLAAFLGLGQSSAQGEYRLLIAAPRFGVNAALCIDRDPGTALSRASDRLARCDRGRGMDQAAVAGCGGPGMDRTGHRPADDLAPFLDVRASSAAKADKPPARRAGSAEAQHAPVTVHQGSKYQEEPSV